MLRPIVIAAVFLGSVLIVLRYYERGFSLVGSRRHMLPVDYYFVKVLVTFILSVYLTSIVGGITNL